MPPSQHPLSQKQLAANRANAAKSTGPRTALGKSRSAQNARKHGFTASTFAVVRLEDLQEVDHLRAGHQPVNSQELFAIERLALTQQALFGDTRLTVSPLVMQRGLCARGAQPPCQGLLRATRLETGLFTTCLNQVLDSSGNPGMAISKSPTPRTASAIRPRPNATTAARSRSSKGSTPCGKNYRTNPFSTPNPNQMKPLNP